MGATDGARVRFTGKERDAETGLDYFGARYFSGTQGRFTSPDPLLNSGRPWLPQSWNRYAYALNNPLRYTDPTGLYEWAANCAGDTQCEENRQRFRDALTTTRTAAEQLKQGSKERNRLDAILKKFGAEGEKNEVKIAFGSAGGYPAEQSTSLFGRTNTITFDMSMIGKALGQSTQANPDYKASIGFAEIVTHEGSHMLEKFLFGNPVNREGSYRTEFNAFESQSYVPMSLNQHSFYGFWNPSWAEVDREALRQKAVQKTTEDHVNEMWGPKKKP